MTVFENHQHVDKEGNVFGYSHLLIKHHNKPSTRLAHDKSLTNEQSVFKQADKKCDDKKEIYNQRIKNHGSR
jgi:hypothetical protein